MKKIIITGGAGFIGSALVRFLVNTKGYKILNYDALKYSGNINSLKNIKKSSRYTFVKGDICNKRLVSKIIFKFRPNIIINCAAETHVDRSIENSYPFVKSNILGTHNLLTCSLNYFNSLDKKKKRIFYFTKFRQMRFMEILKNKIHQVLNNLLTLLVHLIPLQKLALITWLWPGTELMDYQQL